MRHPDTEAGSDTRLRGRALFTVSNELGTVNLFSLAVPMLLEQILNSMIGFINSAVLSGYSDSAVAATGSAATVINMLSLLLTVITTGAGVAISNSIGANDAEGAQKTGLTTVYLCAVIGGALSLLAAVFGGTVMQWMNLEGETLRQATVYFQIRTAFFFLPMISGALTAILRCYGHARVTVISGFAVIVCNLLLNIWVIRFPTHAPLTGVEGIAAGSVISQWLGLLINVLLIRQKRIRFRRAGSFAERLQYAKRILRIGIPSGVSTGAYSLSQMITASFVAIIGMQAVSAKVYYNNILLYSYLFSMCFGSANSFLIGRLIGAGKVEHAKQLNRQLVKLTCLVNFAISAAILLLRIPLLSIFTRDAEILRLSLWIFLLDLLAEQARGVSQVYEYALRGVGDMKFMMAVAIVSCWTCGVGLAYVLSLPLGMGLVGCWIGMVLDEWIRAVASYFRWRKGNWIGLNVLK